MTFNPICEKSNIFVFSNLSHFSLFNTNIISIEKSLKKKSMQFYRKKSFKHQNRWQNFLLRFLVQLLLIGIFLISAAQPCFLKPQHFPKFTQPIYKSKSISAQSNAFQTKSIRQNLEKLSSLDTPLFVRLVHLIAQSSTKLLWILYLSCAECNDFIPASRSRDF